MLQNNELPHPTLIERKHLGINRNAEQWGSLVIGSWLKSLNITTL